MRSSRTLSQLLLILSAAWLSAEEPQRPPSERLVAAERSADVRHLLDEVLDRNPGIAAARAEADAATLQAPQVRSLPDPTAAVTLYLQTPETRVGPQVAMANVSQRFPWFGTLGLREQAALEQAAAAVARVETKRLDVVTEARRLAIELAFLDRREDLVRQDHAALQHFEELARSRYATGAGLTQAVIKLQAEITAADSRLLDIDVQRSGLRARLNALRDRPADAPLPTFELVQPAPITLDANTLVGDAHTQRPEIAGANARIHAAERAIELARKGFRPTVTAGLLYTVVGTRSDADPAGNGKDVLGVTGGLNLPIRRQPREAAVEQAVATRLAAEEDLRGVSARIEADVGDLVRRLPLIAERSRLFDEVLTVQAQEAVDSAVSAYTVGRVGALDLLDAERVQLEVSVAAARAHADIAVAIVDLERAVGGPVSPGGSS